MGIPNRAFSMLTRGYGKASAFAANHVFPAMKTDYMAAKAGFTGLRRGVTQGYINNSFGPGLMGGAMEAQKIGSRGFNAAMSSYKAAGVSRRAGMLRMGGYAAGIGATGMWALGD